MPLFDGELYANVGMRVTCHVSTARYMQRLECELHATFHITCYGPNRQDLAESLG